MRELWRKAVELLKEHPVLWVPAAWASLSSYYLSWLRKLINIQVIAWFRTGHSVLGGPVPVSDPGYSSMEKALLISGPIAVGIQFAMAFGYVLAFYFSAKFVQAYMGDNRIDPIATLNSAKSQWKSILIFSLKLIALIAILMVAIDMPLLGLLRAFHKPVVVKPWFTSVTEVLSLAALAWLLIPAAFRLIAEGPLPKISGEMKKLARLIAVLAGVAGLAINPIASMVVRTFNTSFQPDAWMREFILWPAAAIAGELPLAVLWVVLALIAYRDLQMPEIPSPS